MSIAEKLATVAEKMQKVFDAGKAAEQSDFWDVFQDYGNMQNYRYAFADGRFSDKTYKPKHPIRCSSGSSPGSYMFYRAPISDTKVEIYANTNNINYCFAENPNIITIRLLSVHATTLFNTTFGGCTSLVNLTMDGTIGQNIDLRYSPLSKESIESVVTHLSDTASGMTATFKKTAVLSAFGTTASWTAYIASKPNWTFTLV